MSKKIWGNITWRLFHTMSLCINENNYDQIQASIQCIINICNHLPCPLCSSEASTILKKINVKNIKTKEDFKRFLYFFHNKVNEKLKVPNIEYETIEELHNRSLNSILNEFFKVYKGLKNNSNMMLYSFHRDMIINNTKTYFLNNRNLYRFN